MKLTMMIIMTAFLQVSANTFAQRITLNEKNAPLNKVFDKISEQTGYDFLISTENLKQSKSITISLQNEELKSALDKIFTGQPLSFVIQEKMVVVSRKEPTGLKQPLAPPVNITGMVTDTSGKPLADATITDLATNKSYLSDQSGQFFLVAQTGDKIKISYIGYIPKEITVNRDTKNLLISLVPDNTNLDAVTVLSNGYQDIPKERATGSFVLIDSSLLNRRVGTNILDRLDGVTSGLIFNPNTLSGNNNAAITIRGRSTIFANPNPLIVLDNFPYDGDPGNINPNDIQNITVLKDAAAASIWGVRAGNGVIVITTKKGKKGGAPLVNFNTNFTIGAKPDLFYTYQMSSSDYIDLERFLYNNGYYTSTLSTGYSAVSPAVALMNELSNNQINLADYNSKITALKQVDVRDDLGKYFYRNSTAQQYSLNISGGGPQQHYYISGGYDRDLSSVVTASNDRYTIDANNTYDLFKNRIELFTGINLSKSDSYSNTNQYRPYTPYDQLADQNGNPLPVVDGVNQVLSASYVDTAGKGKLLDWHYVPLNENSSNRDVALTSVRFLTGLTYNVIDHLKLQFNYQYEQDRTDDERTYDQNSFYARDFVNRFTLINSATGVVTKQVAAGDIADMNNTVSDAQYARFQLSYENKFAKDHAINVIAGFEAKDDKTDLNSLQYYGYDPTTGSNANGSINPLAYYQIYYNPYGSQTINTAPSELGTVDRYESYYANMSYVYKGKYTLTASGRKDETNIFGVKANQKGVPLWSTGLGWNVSDENFYHIAALPYLKVRATYGYNGNADKTTSAYLTANALFYNSWNTLYATIINPPNPALGWEQIENINIGVDFGLVRNWLTGSIELYRKNGMDLIGNSPIAPQTGVTVFTGNTADSKTKGADITLNFSLLHSRLFKWNLNVLYNYSLDEITRYTAAQSSNGQIINSNFNNPLPGYPYDAIFAFRSAGLDNTGNPRGYLNGQISTNYSGIYNSTNASELVYKGSGTPTSFGSIRDTWTLREWELSVNLVYKLGYYFRRTGVFTGSSYVYNQGDYDLRWQKPGDELHTTVPALVYPANNFRDVFYSDSENLIEKGDHVRLQDIRLSYHLNAQTLRHLPFKSLQVYSYVNNVGILWRANKLGLDPDYGTQLIPAVRTFSIGLNANF